jgi:1-acyl-sn-glycerol-3-phosphate acyltransferase
VIEFLPALPEDLPSDQVIPWLEEVIEGHSDRLMAEAGFRG